MEEACCLKCNLNVCATLTRRKITKVMPMESAQKHPPANNNPEPILRPIFTCMALAGIHNVTFHPQRPRSIVRRGGSAGLVWCLATGIVVWVFGVLRLLPGFSDVNGLDESTFLKVVIILWYTQCGINIAVCCRLNLRANLLHRLLRLWYHYCSAKAFCKKATPLRRLVWTLTTLYIIFVLCNVALICYILYGNDPNTSQFTAVLYIPFGEHEALKILLVVFQAYVAGAWILPLWLFIIVCTVNRYMLEGTTKTLTQATDEQTQEFNGDLEKLRLGHESACEMVDCADSMFSWFVALSLATDILMACLILYVTIWPDRQSEYLIIFNTFMLLMVAFHLAAIMWAASGVNTEVLMFLSRLQGPPIGMSACQLFIIDRPRVLAIVSILLTYFVILIQMRMPGAMLTDGTGNETAS